MPRVTEVFREPGAASGVEFRRSHRRKNGNSDEERMPHADIKRPLTNDVWPQIQLSAPSTAVLRRQRIVAVRPSEAASRPIAMLRTQLLQAMKAHDFNAFAVSGPTSGCGSSFLAMNLAFSMARQQNLRTVLLDLNLGHPSLAKRLGVPDSVEDFSAFGGEMDVPRKVVRLSENLALGYTTQAMKDASERFQNVTNGGIIDQVRQVLHPDVIIVDTPPVLRGDEVVALAPQLGGVLLVADGLAHQGGRNHVS